MPCLSTSRTLHSGGWLAGGVTSAFGSPPARSAARSVPRATVDVGGRGMALPHIRENCVGTQGSHHSHQWLVGVWRMLNFSPSKIVWRSTRLFRAEVPGIRRTFLHRHYEATRSSVGCSLESMHSSLSSQFLIPLDSRYNYIIN